MQANQPLSIVNDVLDVGPGFIIATPPKGARGTYANELASDFSCGRIMVARMGYVGQVGVLTRRHDPFMDSGLSTCQHLDFLMGDNEDQMDGYVMPNGVVVIDWIDQFLPDGRDTFGEIQRWAEEHNSLVIGIRRRT